ncbi:MAG: hypothetical protein IKL62_01385 [Clostridia bacterium]|nr:hypothetical protein [Clostridia bacterium]
MKSKRVLIILTALAMLVMLFNTVCLVSDTFFYSIDDIPEGKFVRSVPSNYGNEKVNVYLVENPLGNAVRLEAVLDDGQTRNFYWEVGVSDVKVTWIGQTTVYFQDSDRTLDVYKSVYDSRAVNEELDKHFDEQLTEYKSYK